MVRNVFIVEYDLPENGTTHARKWQSFLDLDQVIAWEPSDPTICNYPSCTWHALCYGNSTLVFPWATNIPAAIDAWRSGKEPQ